MPEGATIDEMERGAVPRARPSKPTSGLEATGRGAPRLTPAMRGIIYDDSFVDDADCIAADVEARHGIHHTDAFRDELDWFCAVSQANRASPRPVTAMAPLLRKHSPFICSSRAGKEKSRPINGRGYVGRDAKLPVMRYLAHRSALTQPCGRAEVHQNLRPPFSGLNPKGKVPILVCDDGGVLSEFSAIAIWLARSYPGKNLLPNDIDTEACIAETMSYVEGTIHGQGYARLFVPENFEPQDMVHGTFGLGQSAVRSQGPGERG
jgi:hypothetical protein